MLKNASSVRTMAQFGVFPRSIHLPSRLPIRQANFEHPSQSCTHLPSASVPRSSTVQRLFVTIPALSEFADTIENLPFPYNFLQAHTKF